MLFLLTSQIIKSLQIVSGRYHGLQFVASQWFEGSIFFFTKISHLFSKFKKEIFIMLSYIFYT